MVYTLCRHIRTNGRRCRAASLNESSWCFFHKRLHTSHQRFRHTEATRAYLIPGQHLELAPIEDRESVQLALSMVINALAVGQLETKRATALLYGLQLAGMNVNRLNPPPAAEVVRGITEEPEGLILAEPETHELPTLQPVEEKDEEDLEDEDFEEGDEEEYYD
ncbi:hypothetical protein [Granulicella sibirica]|uniref:Uncharacterized protein n=1 Tax=Granulicella sibirica TaxID=2479048 RepID=A0A4V1L5F6_9BACT|nr:hypothetical protein [Granulicella sibirica]RXH55594.1 hypothetical protein GRAN_2451 [Granulicella sibirica]